MSRMSPAPNAGATSEPVTSAKLVPIDSIIIPTVNEPKPRPAKNILSCMRPTMAALTS